jgi:hypothetical protein
MITARTPALAAVWLMIAGLGWGHPATAGGKTTKVTIETDPPGAKVYFNVKEDGEVCTTPCTIDAPLGETPMIIEAENRRSLFENLVVPKKTARPIKLSYKLELAVGTLIVEGGAGALIKIDEEARGSAPARIEGVLAGAHRVVVEQNGKVLYDQFLEIEVGGEATVLAAPAVEVAVRPEVIAAPTPAPPPRTPIAAVSGLVDIGFRRFRYHDNQTPATQRDDDEAGQVLTGPVIEVWPTTLLGLGVLPGLALYGRFEFGLNAQPVTLRDSLHTGTSLSTAWHSFEVSLHQRWAIAEIGTVEVGAGYAEDAYQFHSSPASPADLAIVPDARYQAVRFGSRASLVFGWFEPYLTAENRIVFAGGAMDHRYELGSSVFGFHGALGARARLGQFEARVEAGLTVYSWTFKPATGAPTFASGGTDLIENITFAVGYAY